MPGLNHGRSARPRKLYEGIAETVEGWIRSGRFTEGQRLPSERELMRMLGTGRTSVREALFALDRMGLISVRSGGRAVVSRPDAGVILGDLSGVVASMLADVEGRRQFQDARRLWESAVARRAARLATPQDIDALEDLLEANRSALGDAEGFARTDVAFHDRIARICGNPLFDNLNKALATWLTEQRLTSLRSAGTAELAFAAHSRILDALSRRDPDATEAAMDAHLAEVGKAYWRSAESEPHAGGASTSQPPAIFASRHAARTPR